MRYPKPCNHLTSPNGFSHLLCGDLSSDPNAKPVGTTGCWALDGKVTWESPTAGKGDFYQPGNPMAVQPDFIESGFIYLASRLH